MKKNLLLISLFVVSISYGQIKTLKANIFTSSQCTAGGVTTIYYPNGGAYVPANLISKHAGESPDSNWKMELVVDQPGEIWIAAEVVFLTAMPSAGAPYPMADMLSISSSDYTLTAYANRTREEDKTLNCTTAQVTANQHNKIRFNLQYNGTYVNGTDITFDITITDPASNVTETINVTVSPIESTASIDKLKKYDFSFGPNPTEHSIYLSAVKSIGNVEVFNLVGQKFLSTDMRDTKGTLDISNLLKGVYIMNVTIDENIGTYKIIKE